jgi:hypothetical protein
VPIKEFTPDDTKKLCWAALEIGKLVEREISYRGSHSKDDPIPLTALEFYRIPISGLSFVDDLRQRRGDANKIKVHVDHHIQNSLYTMHLEDVRFASRIKGHRSYLARLGERHEGFVRGNLAIWFYLLSLQLDLNKPVDQEGDASKRDSIRDFNSLRCNLHQFQQSVRNIGKQVVEKQPKGAFAPQFWLSDEDDTFFKQTGNILIGDTRFASPAFFSHEPTIEESPIEESTIKKLQERILTNLKN